jgi:alkylglycerol monooxygenase
VFYLPMALAVPPSVFAVHIEFNLLYQFWIHTEVSRLCAWVCVRVCV